MLKQMDTCVVLSSGVLSVSVTDLIPVTESSRDSLCALHYFTISSQTQTIYRKFSLFSLCFRFCYVVGCRFRLKAPGGELLVKLVEKEREI